MKNLLYPPTSLIRAVVLLLIVGCAVSVISWLGSNGDKQNEPNVNQEDISPSLQQIASQIQSKPIDARNKLLVFINSIGQNDEALNLLSMTYERECQAARTIAEEALVREEQVQQYQELSEAHPGWPELLYQLASQRLVLQRLKPERFDLFEAAIEELQEVVDLGEAAGNASNVASGYFQLGRTYKHQGDTLSALGKTYAVEDRYRLALDSFTDALRLDSSRVDAVGEIVLIHLSQDDMAAAEMAVRENLPSVSNKFFQGKLWEMLGDLQKRQNKIEESKKSFETALELNSRLMGAYLHLSAIYLKRGEPTRAEQMLKQSIVSEPGFLRGYLDLGYTYMNQKRYEVAREVLENMLRVPMAKAKMIGMLPSRTLYRNGLYYQGSATLAWIYLELGELDKAEKTAHEAAQFQPMEEHLIDTMGSIYAAKSDRQQAIKMFEQAIQLADLPASHYHLAQLYFGEGKLEQARDHLSKAMKSEKYFFERNAAKELIDKISGGQDVKSTGPLSRGGK